MFQQSFTLMRIAGIPVGIHYTWLFAAGLLGWSLAEGYFPARYPGWETSTYWIAGVVAALGLFAGVVIHELGHSLVAISRGIPVKQITLFIFGGVAQIKEAASSPLDEFLVGVAGPLTSFALAALAWGGTQLAASGSPEEAVLGYLAFVNTMLGAFNLVPGFPLDGGRVLRAAVWKVTGSERKATRWASYVGQGFGYLLIFLGISRLLGGDTLGGLWTALIGTFLNGAAATSRKQHELKDRLRGVRVADLMDRDPAVVGLETSVQEFVYLHLLRRGRRAVLVADDGGRLQGLVSVTDVKEVPQPAWPATTLDTVMTRVPLKTVSPSAGVDTALKLLVEGEFDQVPVLEDGRDGRVVGMLSRAAILRVVQLQEALDIDINALPPRPLRPPAVSAASHGSGTPLERDLPATTATIAATTTDVPIEREQRAA